MPLAINNATKVLPVLLFGGKEYIALMHLHKEIDEQLLRNTFNKFIGKITQLPPVRSHVKRQYRQREIYYSDILEINGRDVLFKVGVESGTYIRKLIHDMGEELEVGAHMSELRRTKVSTLSERDSLVTLQDLDDAVYFYKEENDGRLLDRCLGSIESAIDFLPKIFVSDTAVDPICHGSPLAVPGAVKLTEFEKDETVAIMTLKGEIIALGKAVLSADEIKTAKKGVAIKTDSVIMNVGTYPPYKKIK
ncbi:MAG: RNA-guided pseudouridylation complex pseudouridine synthase subunit Cbf5 [Candidatus Parvarchaeota archaeon]|nr:RNA-guided pseudouridylation complex pseudouridine synthase subunit Cbf5 [Candidatus Parvarchaeota archaeon]MCL5420626.1 RNA-guided pseudouridylation complex pseudouridine synthase subunit Cbf5 [Candidatus Parvarchaeota archaeon]